MARERQEQYDQFRHEIGLAQGAEKESEKEGEEPVFDFLSYTVRDGEELRLDRFLAERSGGAYSREYLKDLILDGHVVVDGLPSKPSQKLRYGQLVEVTVPPPAEMEVSAEEIPLQIFFEDEHLLVAKKPRGMLTHPIGRQQSGTFVNALLHHCGDSLSGIAGTLRPGIVHRLDRVTSGLLVVAKSAKAHYGMQDLFRTRQIEKRYLALVEGRPADPRGLIDAPLGRHPIERNTFRVHMDGRPSQTSYHRLRTYGRTTLVELFLHTGRTHQIRVHLRFIGHPIIGDVTYGAKEEPAIPQGIALHAWRLRFTHPITGEEVHCRAPLPEDMLNFLRKCRTEE